MSDKLIKDIPEGIRKFLGLSLTQDEIDEWNEKLKERNHVCNNH